MDSLGIRLVDGGGQPKVFGPAKALHGAGIPCGLFLDNEKNYSGQRKAFAEETLCAFATWDKVRNVEEATAAWLPWDRLTGLVELAARLNEKELQDLLQAVSTKLGKQERETLDVLQGKYSEDPVRKAVAEAALDGKWFKDVERGRELGKALVDWGLPGEIRAILERFLAALQTKAK